MNRSAILSPALVLLLQPVAASAQPAGAEGDAAAHPARSRLVTVSVELDAQGRVQQCRVTGSSGVKELDELSCRAVRENGHYEPVLDEDGKPVPASIIHTLTWSPAEAEAEPQQLADMGPPAEARP